MSAALVLAGLGINSHAATWNDAYGMGVANGLEDWRYTISGVPFAVITSVQSNTVYGITSCRPGIPASIEDISFKTDLCASGAALKFWVATNMWRFSSNGTAGATTFWLSTTNSQMASNDICVVRDVANDCYQMIVISGNATDYAGTVSTNALGEVQVKTFNAISNAITAGDELYKMTAVFTVNPLTITSITNAVPLIGAYPTNANTCFSQWLPLTFNALGGGGTGVKFRARGGLPAMVTLTYSNAGGLLFATEYLRRPR